MLVKWKSGLIQIADVLRFQDQAISLVHYGRLIAVCCFPYSCRPGFDRQSNQAAPGMAGALGEIQPVTRGKHFPQALDRHVAGFDPAFETQLPASLKGEIFPCQNRLLSRGQNCISPPVYFTTSRLEEVGMFPADVIKRRD
jgi:hypothetical protein